MVFLRTKIQRGLYWLGMLLSIFGIFYVTWRFNEYIGQIDLSHLKVSVWLCMGIGSLMCSLANVFSGISWSYLLRFLGINAQIRWSVAAFGVSQLAKYLPGNVMHIIGRQAMGMSAEIDGAVVAKSIIWELGLISFTGVLFSFLALPLFVSIVSETISFMIFLGLVLIVFFLLKFWLGIYITKAFIFDLLYLAINGFVFSSLLKILLIEMHGFYWASLCGSYVVAWLIGLVTPGAPAGVGVREMMLLFFLQGAVPKETLFFAVVLGRIVTIAGDMIYFLLSFIYINLQKG